MRRGSVYQRHTANCPRDGQGAYLPHRCRGRWSFSLVIAPRADGHRRQLARGGFATKRDAERGLQEAMAREEAGVANIHGLTVAQHLDLWVASKRSIRETTRRGYETDIRKYLHSAIGHIRLADLRAHHIDEMYSALLSRRDPASPSTIRHLHTTLRASLNAAVKRRLIPWNPAQHIELPSYVRPGVCPLLLTRGLCRELVYVPVA